VLAFRPRKEKQQSLAKTVSGLPALFSYISSTGEI